MITIIGLGPGSKDDLTLKTLDIMKNAKVLYFRTEIHPNVEYLKSIGIRFKSFDYLYESMDNFDSVYESIAEKIIELKDVVYAVPGNPMVAEKSVQLIIKYADEKNIEYEIVPAVSFIDSIIKTVKIDPIEGLKIIDGLELDSQRPDLNVHNIITQIYNPLVASDIKIKLMDYYDDAYEVYLIRAAGVLDGEKIEKLPLYEIDRVDWVDYLTSLYIPPCTNEKRYDLEALVDVMKKLRSEDGCPWDKEQTHESLERYLIEECYEVIDAIKKDDSHLLEEELGDVLFQIIFHSQIAFEDGEFNIYDVIHEITNKMINRHTHVFSNDVCLTSDEVLINWEKNKKVEKSIKSYTESLKSVPECLPALMRSYKIQEKASQAGFDWDNVDDVIEKVKEELKEFLEVYKTQEKGKILEEMGDMLFSIVNVSRFMSINPEFALNSTSDKFIRRFEHVENGAKNLGKKLEDMTLQEMDILWNEAKKNENIR